MEGVEPIASAALGDEGWPASRDPTLAWLTRVHGGADAATLLRRLLIDAIVGRVALVSSFGADSAVLLHLVAAIAPATPVLFLDTGQHFAETLAHRDRLVAALGLRDVRTVRLAAATLARADPEGTRHRLDPDGCCRIRKIAPAEAALADFDGWITGRRRDQSPARARLARFERDREGRVKVSPLAAWSAADVEDYRARHDLPAHSLVAHGYPSIGCAPCTTAVAASEDPRAGRWRGRAKTECGLHVGADGRLTRAPQAPD